MFGLGDFSVSLVFVLLILSTLLCVVYGAMNWNNDGEESSMQDEAAQWEKDEKTIEDGL